MLKKDWTTCLNFVNHSRCKGQHNGETLYDHAITQRIFTFDNEHDIHTSVQCYEASDFMHYLNLLIILHELHVSYPMRVVPVLDPLTLHHQKWFLDSTHHNLGPLGNGPQWSMFLFLLRFLH